MIRLSCTNHRSDRCTALPCVENYANSPGLCSQFFQQFMLTFLILNFFAFLQNQFFLFLQLFAFALRHCFPFTNWGGLLEHGYCIATGWHVIRLDTANGEIDSNSPEIGKIKNVSHGTDQKRNEVAAGEIGRIKVAYKLSSFVCDWMKNDRISRNPASDGISMLIL